MLMYGQCYQLSRYQNAAAAQSDFRKSVTMTSISLAFRNGGIRFYLNDCDTAFINTNLAQIKK
jgi:hypothetical protein